MTDEEEREDEAGMEIEDAEEVLKEEEEEEEEEEAGMKEEDAEEVLAENREEDEEDEEDEEGTRAGDPTRPAQLCWSDFSGL